MAGGFRKTIIRAIGRLGETVWAQWDELRHAAAVIGTVLYVCVWPRYWVRTVRKAFVRQIVAIGVESVGFVGVVAVFVGITVVVQLVFWVGQAGQSQMLGPLLVAVVARELSPVLISLVVIVRSGSVMATELGIMKIDGRRSRARGAGNLAVLLSRHAARAGCGRVHVLPDDRLYSGHFCERVFVRGDGGERQP